MYEACLRIGGPSQSADEIYITILEAFSVFKMGIFLWEKVEKDHIVPGWYS